MKNYSKFIALAATLLASGSVFAQDAGATAAAGHGAGAAIVGGWVALAAGIAIAVAAFGGAFAQGKAASAALEGIARNPAASGKLFLPLILSLALIESLVIYALVIAFQLNTQLATIIAMFH